MNLAHLHIILNHFPTIGTVIGLAAVAFAFLAKNDELKRFSLGLFLVTGILVIPTYMTGEATSEIIGSRSSVSEAYIQAHRSSAVIALLFSGITAGFAWLGLWHHRRRSALSHGNFVTVVVLAILTVGLMINTGTAGGEISHLEIRPGGAQEPAGPYLAASIEEYILLHSWVWPAAEALHFIGMALLFGIVLLINLRMLGVIRGIPFTSLHALLPWGMGAFAVNLLTGMLFFIGVPLQYTQNISFFYKVVLILVAGFNVVYFTVFDGPWKVKAQDVPPLSSKVMAATTIVVWVGIIYFGRMLPYIGNAF